MIYGHILLQNSSNGEFSSTFSNLATLEVFSVLNWEKIVMNIRIIRMPPMWSVARHLCDVS